MEQFNELQLVKRRFFAMRNGVIADTLRKAGSPYKIIFGLNLPQISDIAMETGKNETLARRLWANDSTRESMLMAPMIMPTEAMSMPESERWVEESPAVETTDILCHRLLRNLPYAYDLAKRLMADEMCDMKHYAAMRILWHFLSSNQEEILSMARDEYKRNNPMTIGCARQIIDEIEFLNEG